MIGNSFVGFITSVLTVLVIFNLSWLVMFIRLYTRLSAATNLNRIILNLESILLLENLGIFILFVGYALRMKRLRSILGRKY